MTTRPPRTFDSPATSTESTASVVEPNASPVAVARRFMRGPIARATNNTDLSWLAAFVVSGALYYILRPLLAREEQPSEAPTPAA